MNRTTLVIQDLAGQENAFRISRLSDAKSADTAPIASPYVFPVEGRPNSNLIVELQWYLEEFLDYPFPPDTDRAEAVLHALNSWGEQAFRALFEHLGSGALFNAATANDYSRLTLRIASDRAGILSWPWEALRDPRLGALAHACQIERRLNEILDAPEMPELPQDRVNILLVVARPYGDRDVRYRSLARSLVELIADRKLPAHVDLLRPPTFDQLREHLHQHPGHYHILHFDGHGSFSASPQTSGGTSARASPNAPHVYGAPEGHLVFETQTGTPSPISASQPHKRLSIE